MPMHMHDQLEALKDRRPPWLRPIITHILPTVKMLNLGGSGTLSAPRSPHVTAIMVIFAHLLTLEDLDHHQN